MTFFHHLAAMIPRYPLHQIILIFLSSQFLCFSGESSLDLSNFNQAWSDFKQSRAIDYSQIDKESYQEYEFSLLEEFTKQQFFRYRPYIETVDRYKTRRPYFENKITLLDGTEMSGSFIRLTNLGEKYHDFIVTQAPFKQNIPFFWQMVLENEIDQIVMTTELFEMDNPKKELAYPYWPQEKNEKIILENGLEITFIEEMELLPELKEKVQIRKFNLHDQGIDRIVTHYWYRHWLDGTAPSQSQTILALIKCVEEYKNASGSNSPILVHCSAGSGRTGVFIVLYHLMQRFKYMETLNLFDFIAYLRWQRPYLVSRLPQYKFCYEVKTALLIREEF
jgi:protein tyrosine phosphatase